jgi:hypothetical protein
MREVIFETSADTTLNAEHSAGHGIQPIDATRSDIDIGMHGVVIPLIDCLAIGLAMSTGARPTSFLITFGIAPIAPDLSSSHHRSDW